MEKGRKPKLGKAVWVTEDVVRELEKLRRHPRETYSDIISRLLAGAGKA